MQITTKRDLEDFAGIHFLADPTLTSQLSQSANATSATAGTRPTVHYGLKMNSGAAQIRLFSDRPQSGPLDHVSNADAADALVGKYSIADIGQAETIFRSLPQPDRDGRFPYLFEALGTAGRITLEYTVSATYPQPASMGGQPLTTARTHTLDLDLRDIKDLYTRTQVPCRNGARDDRFTHFVPGTQDLAHFGAAHALFSGNTRGIPFLSGTDTVVLVHGWNMTDGTKPKQKSPHSR